MEWKLGAQIAEMVATALALSAATSCAVISARVGTSWTRFWWALTGLLVVHIGRRSWEIGIGRLEVTDSALLWTFWFSALAVAATLRAVHLARLIGMGDHLGKLKAMTLASESAVGEWAKRIEERAERVEKILEQEGDRQD